jgi:outer membrane protein assembly factor BamD (BamD/ComL family)
MKKSSVKKSLMKKSLIKKSFASSLVLAAALSISPVPSFGQGKAKTGPDPSLIHDSELEKDSKHNLEVARHYFKLKKAYVAAIKRCEEIDVGNPTFAQLDEVLFIAGESSLRLAENRGKQKTKDKSPEELRQDARVYLSRLVAGYPNSQFRKQAETDLQTLGGPIEVEQKQ